MKNLEKKSLEYLHVRRLVYTTCQDERDESKQRVAQHKDDEREDDFSNKRRHTFHNDRSLVAWRTDITHSFGLKCSCISSATNKFLKRILTTSSRTNHKQWLTVGCRSWVAGNPDTMFFSLFPPTTNFRDGYKLRELLRISKTKVT